MAHPPASLPTYERPLAPTARRAAVLGSPIGHSLSPVLHTAAYAALGLAGWRYGHAECDERDLPAMIAALDSEWVGLSLTMPLKQAALGLLDVVDPLAQVVGGVNTVLVQPTGASRLLTGANTDVHGVVAALQETAGPAWAPRRAVILGAGATAAATLAALAQLGMTTSTVLARSPGRAAGLQLAAHRMGVDVQVVKWREQAAAAALLHRADVVVSTLPAGAGDELGAHLADAAIELGTHQVLLDVVYDPWPTALAGGWQARGGAIAPGWLMLLHQAAEQVRLMTGRPGPVPAMREALRASLAPGGGDGPVRHRG